MLKGEGRDPKAETLEITAESFAMRQLLQNLKPGIRRSPARAFANRSGIVTTGYGFRECSWLKTKPDKGHASQFAEFRRRVSEKVGPPIRWKDMVNVTKARLAWVEAVKTVAWARPRA